MTFAYSRDIIVPSERLLEEFDEVADPVFDQINVLNQYNEKLAQARDILLPKLMSGEIGVSPLAAAGGHE